MHLVYIDDSGDNNLVCFSAICFPAQSWRGAFEHLVGARRHMKDSDNIFVRKELHATDFLSGRGRVAPHFVAKAARGRLFNYMLSAITRLPAVQIFNACGTRNRHETVFRNLITRIDTNMRKAGSLALLICDEGKDYNAMLRRMRRYNPIPSRYGAWEDGSPYKNIPVDHVIEDINYRDSKHSLFVQAADFCAYSLHRYENPLPSKSKIGVAESFRLLEPALVKAANGKDPYGIIRG